MWTDPCTSLLKNAHYGQDLLNLCVTKQTLWIHDTYWSHTLYNNFFRVWSNDMIYGWKRYLLSYSFITSYNSLDVFCGTMYHMYEDNSLFILGIPIYEEHSIMHCELFDKHV